METISAFGATQAHFFDYFRKDAKELKILIVSTPKTGNTWLKYLLSTIYNLPVKSLGVDFQTADLESLGSRWITHQHYYPEGDLLEWARQNEVTLITTIRHPCDTAVSNYHYVNRSRMQKEFDDELDLLLLDHNYSSDKVGLNDELFPYFRKRLFIDLNLSILWQRTNRSFIVRYEDLWCDPVDTLFTLTQKIAPVTLNCIERAIALCNINLFRDFIPTEAGLVRKGGIGGWREVLSDKLIQWLRESDPYPLQFDALGYTLDFEDPIINREVKASNHFPITLMSHFDNGVKNSPTIIRLYLSFDSTVTQQWSLTNSDGAPNSFFNWLNSPAPGSMDHGNGQLLVTNLAAYVYYLRDDIQKNFPDLFGQHRLEYVRWFLKHGGIEHKLDAAFLADMRASWYNWANSLADEDPNLGKELPIVSNLAAYIYYQRPDMQESFPNPYGADRAGFLNWFVQNAKADHELEEEVIEPVRQSLIKWGNLPYSGDPYANVTLPVINNWSVHVYHLKPELQKNFPDIYGRDRSAFTIWLIAHGRGQYPFDLELLLSITKSWAQMSNLPAEDLLPI